MFNELKAEVCRVNQALVDSGLVILTWGNVSGADRQAGVMAIKPSGVDYAKLTPDDIVVVNLADGKVIEGKARPSSDTPTHLHLYRVFPNIGGIVHTHSRHATAWAQAGRDLPCYGTTHADHFGGAVPCARLLTPAEVESGYEANTGIVVEECFRQRGLNPDDVPGVLLHGHAPFTWGKTPQKALDNAIALEACAQMAFEMLLLNPNTPPLPPHILNKHWNRKHGPGAYYGQPGG
ncbi:MAG: L-ribulose-5-phosphate 4-epimerase AraD [Limisphaerales bacterium]